MEIMEIKAEINSAWYRKQEFLENVVDMMIGRETRKETWLKRNNITSIRTFEKYLVNSLNEGTLTKALWMEKPAWHGTAWEIQKPDETFEEFKERCEKEIVKWEGYIRNAYLFDFDAGKIERLYSSLDRFC